MFMIFFLVTYLIEEFCHKVDYKHEHFVEVPYKIYHIFEEFKMSML
jgi:hypothetical protein